MDVAKYIGLFLLKNEQCYITGLGTLQFVRKGGNYDGQSLHAAHHEVTLVPGGNVDESLANFIATNEMTSISKASDTLKEYSAATKATLQDGKEVTIPYIGNFALRDGRIIFITDPLLLYKSANIPAQRGASLQHNERPSGPQGFVLPKAAPNPNLAMPGAPPTEPMQGASQQSYAPPPQEGGGKLNWWRIIFVLLLLIIMAGGAYYGYYRFLAPKKRTNTTQPLTLPEINDMSSDEEAEEQSRMETSEPTSIDDSSATADMQGDDTDATVNNEQPKEKKQEERRIETEQTSNKRNNNNNDRPKPTETAPPPVTNVKPEDVIRFDAVINTYDNKAQAYARMRDLRRYGSAKVIEEDTNYYFVAIPIKTTKDRKKRVLDSLTSKYNMDGVFVY